MLLDTPKAELGWQAATFRLSNPSGESFSLQQLQGEKGLLIAFICNHCPYVKAIIDRLVADAKALQAQGINVVAISSNDYSRVPEDSPQMMAKFAAAHNFCFEYLVDQDQSVARDYAAVFTPDFFGFNTAGQLQYRGRLDDARLADATNRRPELLQAMLEIACTGRTEVIQHSSIGCSIKWHN